MKLNLGCWNDIKKWYINIDKIKLPGVDILHDIEDFPYPFNNDIFEEIYCAMVLEHTINLTGIMEEFIRIAKKWCQIKIIVPYFTCTNFWADPTHVRLFNSNSFSWFHGNSFLKKDNIVLKKYKIHFFSNNNNNFMQSKRYSILPDFIINLCPKIYERFFCYIFPSSEIHFLLEIQKKDFI